LPTSNDLQIENFINTTSCISNETQAIQLLTSPPSPLEYILCILKNYPREKIFLRFGEKNEKWEDSKQSLHIEKKKSLKRE